MLVCSAAFDATLIDAFLAYFSTTRKPRDTIPSRPLQKWFQNCWVSLSRFEDLNSGILIATAYLLLVGFGIVTGTRFPDSGFLFLENCISCIASSRISLVFLKKIGHKVGVYGTLAGLCRCVTIHICGV